MECYTSNTTRSQSKSFPYSYFFLIYYLCIVKRSSLGSFVHMRYSIRDGTKGHHVLNGGEGALNVENGFS